MTATADPLVVLLVDFANVRQGLELLAESGAAAPSSSDVVSSLLRFAGGGGRVGTARAFADWTRDAEGPRILVGTRLDPVMVPATAEGDDRSHIRLAVDAVELLYDGDDPDAFVIVSDDPSLVPLARAIRRTGCHVVVVAPAGDAGELGAEADLALSLAEVVAGTELEPVRLRPARAARGGARGKKARREKEERRPAVPMFDPGHGPDPDFSTYEWPHFIRLISELEARLPFVGVRYLVNKVLAPHNCGIGDPRLKRDLINEAVDQGIIELYAVGNVEERLDPVTACRLDRQNHTVRTVLGAEAARVAAEGELDGDEIDTEEDFEPFEDFATSTQMDD